MLSYKMQWQPHNIGNPKYKLKICIGIVNRTIIYSFCHISVTLEN